MPCSFVACSRPSIFFRSGSGESCTWKLPSSLVDCFFCATTVNNKSCRMFMNSMHDLFCSVLLKKIPSGLPWEACWE